MALPDIELLLASLREAREEPRDLVPLLGRHRDRTTAEAAVVALDPDVLTRCASQFRCIPSYFANWGVFEATLCAWISCVGVEASNAVAARTGSWSGRGAEARPCHRDSIESHNGPDGG